MTTAAIYDIINHHICEVFLLAICKNLIGEKFGYLEVVGRAPNTKDGKARWKCICKCGGTTIATSNDLISKHTQSCGCKKFESHNKRHGQTKTDIHNKWCSMRQRCYDTNHKCYLRYGAVGITVCDEWNKSFEAFRDWSYAHGYKEGLSIDRIDNTKGYSPENCRWVPWCEQSKNRRSNIMITYSEKTQPLKTWCDELNLNYHLIWQRMRKYGYTFEQAISK